MSKAIVNMTPNPSDIQTIHCSQGDTEAREWEFELHNNGEVIDAGGITEQMVFKSYKGGTEQLLPENGAVPVTAPFVGDIKYPDATRTDQEFLYRQSPTEEDGLAKITDIKGNTLVWNQLLNVNTASNFIALENGIINLSGTPTGSIRLMSNSISHISGHKYLFREVTLANPNNISFTIGAGSGSPWLSTAGVIGDHSAIYTSTYTTYLSLYDIANKTLDGIKFTCQIFDLTQMFGAGKEPTTVEAFTSLFPLLYYAYNSGSLLSFNGSGIKTVGKNQLDTSVFSNASSYTVNDDGSLTVNASDPRAWTTVNTFHLKKGNYILTRSVPNGSCDIRFEYEDFATSHLISNQLASYPFTVAQDADVKIKIGYSYSAYPFTTNVMIRFADADATFEPYATNTTNLPTETYFPTGMKSAGSVYDELAPTRAITRIGTVDLGSISWTAVTVNNITRMRSYDIKTTIKYPALNSTKVNAVCSKYDIETAINTYIGTKGFSCQNNGDIYVYDPEYTDATAFKTAMDGVMLYYELATPLENYGVVDLGSLTWYSEGTNTSGIIRMGSTGIRDFVKKPTSGSVRANIVCDLYATETADRTYLKNTGISINTGGVICVYDANYNTSDKIASFKSAVSGVYLLYEKENPQGFTIASLVTENAEIPLSNEDGVLIGKCTEQLSAEPGFHDAKIKLADEDGECYSNKIQLHIERSPQ